MDCGLLDGWTYGVNEHMPNTLFCKVPASRRCKKVRPSKRLDPVGPVAKVRPLANDAQAAKVGTIASKEYPNSACLIMDFQRFSMDFQWISADSPYISADFPLIFHGFSRILHGFPWIFHRIPRRPLPFLGQDFFPKTRLRNSDS